MLQSWFVQFRTGPIRVTILRMIMASSEPDFLLEHQDYFSWIGLKFGQDPIFIDSPLRILARPYGSGIWTATCICRKDAIQRMRGFDERMRIVEDIRLWFRLALEGKFAVTAKPL